MFAVLQTVARFLVKKQFFYFIILLLLMQIKYVLLFHIKTFNWCSQSNALFVSVSWTLTTVHQKRAYAARQRQHPVNFNPLY